jgi:transitional endoplasmic reticulum ATPase
VAHGSARARASRLGPREQWVGETEKAIARAFAEAEADDAVLLFDEADSFLSDRTGAVRSWEVSQVNEFLQQLESFRGVCACTTNLVDDLDQAALRRFVFKVPFTWLRPEQVVALFGATFPWCDPAPVARELAANPHLTPGDFAAVSRRVRAVGEEPDATGLVRMLRDEVAVKRVGGRAIGF